MTRHAGERWGKRAIRGAGGVVLFWGSAVGAAEGPGTVPPLAPVTGAFTLEMKVLPLTRQDAAYLALLNNRDVKIDRLNPEVAATEVAQARAVFHPSFSMESNASHAQSGSGSILNGATTPTSDNINWSAGLKARLISGAMAALDFTNSRASGNSSFLTLNPQYTSSLLFTLTQPLLKDFGPKVNTIRIKLAQNSVTMSRHQAQGTVAAVLANAENSYWDLVLGFKEQDIRRKAVDLARRLLDRTRELVQEGLLPEISVFQAETALTQRGGELAVATNALADAVGRLQDALNLDVAADVQIVPLDQPTLEVPEVQLEQVVREALARRPELPQAKLELKNRNLQVDLAKNQTLPQLNLVFSYGWSGFAGRETGLLNDPLLQPIIDQLSGVQTPESSQVGGYGRALGNLLAGDNPNWKVGFNFTMPFGNVAATNELRRASLAARKAALTVKDVERKITLEVERAARQIQTSRRTVDGTRALRQQTERRLEMTQEQFELGLAPMSAVVEAQQDLATAEREEWRTIVDYNKTLVLFDKAIGATLEKYRVAL